ncbi:MAG: polyamine aminopropyltransferase [Acidobacteria bacterium]|nr:polyamine aminopropyltransferase [Acidobacteriota bacterium]
MPKAPLLYLNVLIIAACGLIYELLAGTLASYVLGDSITQFSLIIGLYLSALGIGAWLSRFVTRELAARFVDVELAVAVAGGFSAPLLFLGFSRGAFFHVLLYGLVILIGTLVGLELPLLMRILKDNVDFSELVSKVLSFDYVGSLFAAILFPLLLVPRLGLIRTSLLFGLFNAAVGLYGTFLMRALIERGVTGLRIRSAIVIALLATGLFNADRLTRLSEEHLFADPVVYASTSPYQRILITKDRWGFQLFLNGNLQFSSSDEYRYHEALVHPALSSVASPKRVLILGGGDGLALREILRYPSVERITLVDLDPAMTRLYRSFPPLGELNRHSMDDPRVEVVNADAMIWLEETTGARYDAAIVDFPDPSNFALGKLYTTRFYRLLKERLAPHAAVSVQSTSPLFARRSFWCVVRTMEAAGFRVRPYQTTVPAFGVWGFALATINDKPQPYAVPSGLRYLTPSTLSTLFNMPADMGPVDVEINRLDNQILVRYYEEEWRRWS